MTGETDAIKKGTLEYCQDKKKAQESEVERHKIPSPIILSGTKVMNGVGKMVVLVVGKYSCSGKI